VRTTYGIGHEEMGHHCQIKFTMPCTGNEMRAAPRGAGLGEDEGN